MAQSDKSWNVDKYRNHYESDEHWAMRKLFLETHKDTLAEDDLVCMAQVFFNIENLGCKYPETTMRKIAELSKDIATEFRKMREGRLKRTFMGASAAAEAKVKRLKTH